jgi:ribosomal 50S subunit-recycling heat shock protein
MRVDLYLKLMGVTKTRMLAKRLCDQGKVFLGGKAIKPSQEVLAGETLELFLPQR